jgi:hypothetical protein
MSDPEPRALRLYVLLATVLVVFGGVAGFLWWWVAHHAPKEEAPDVSPVVLGPVDFLPETTPEDRARLTALLDRAIFENPDPRRPSPADEEIVAMGERAAARLVDAFHRLSLGAGFRDEANRHRGGAVDRLLGRIQRRLPPAPVPQPRGRADDPAGVMERRARAWRVWWDALQAKKAATPSAG